MDERPTGTVPREKAELDRRIRLIAERVDRERRNRPAPIPNRPWMVSWQGSLLTYIIAAGAGISGYFMSEWFRWFYARPLVEYPRLRAAEPLVGPPDWLISLTVAVGMAWVFRGLARMFVKDFAWGYKW